jgi:hypothetical protein
MFESVTRSKECWASAFSNAVPKPWNYLLDIHKNVDSAAVVKKK